MKKMAIVLVTLVGIQATLGGVANEKNPKDYIINASADVLEVVELV